MPDGSQAASALALPFLWPLAVAAGNANALMELASHGLGFIGEEMKIGCGLHPELATPNRVILDLRTLRLRDFSAEGAGGVPAIVVAPYAGHTSAIADYAPGQSLVQTLLASGVGRVCMTDWKSATEDMAGLEIDQYLAELNVCVEELGGRVSLVGLCQGGWMSAMYAARFPNRVARLVLAGSPIDTDAGDGPLKAMVRSAPGGFYEEMVAAGGGLMRGKLMLAGWKNMHPGRNYVQKHIELYGHIGDPEWVRRNETFEAWYETTVDLPGRWYLQAIHCLFQENQFAKGEFVGLGKRLSLRDITCPVYMLAGEDDDITTADQVFNAAGLIGTPGKMPSPAWFPAAISACSWVPARCATHGPKSAGGFPAREDGRRPPPAPDGAAPRAHGPGGPAHAALQPMPWRPKGHARR
jgi:poly(3-hydroxyalkanoate) synthetase